MPEPIKRVPRYCPACGEPDPHATELMIWCTRCRWEASRVEVTDAAG